MSYFDDFEDDLMYDVFSGPHTFERDDEWRTKDGRTIKIKDMEDRHLQNSYNFLKRKAMPHALDYYQKGLNNSDLKLSDILEQIAPKLAVLEKEIERRKGLTNQKEPTRKLDL